MSLMVMPEPVPLAADRDGVMRVGGTRVTLDTVVAAFREGATAEEITQQYPSLQLADVYAVIGYYLRHQPEVDDYLRERRARGTKCADLTRSGSTRRECGIACWRATRDNVVAPAGRRREPQLRHRARRSAP